MAASLAWALPAGHLRLRKPHATRTLLQHWAQEEISMASGGLMLIVGV